MEKIKISAPAKINLSLDIKGLRSDGYHELEMIMQTVSLYDIIKMEKDKKGINLTVSDKSLPEDRNNLAYQAAQLILQKAEIASGINIFIKKNIPVAAGLAGGSTDAAAVLKGINRLFGLKYKYSKLKKLAGEIGTDVPFCLKGGTALAVNKGDRLRQLPDIGKYRILIINPGLKIETKKVYQKYDEIKPVLDIPTSDLIKVIKSGNKINWDEGWNNVLEPVTMKLTREVGKIKKILKQYKSVKFNLMSGSGPTVYAVVESKTASEKVIKSWPRPQDKLFAASFINKDKGFNE